jgi:hypothetical protein
MATVLGDISQRIRVGLDGTTKEAVGRAAGQRQLGRFFLETVSKDICSP